MASFFARAQRKAMRIAIRTSRRFRFPVSVAVIGYGEIAPDHVESYEATGIARVVAVSDLVSSNLARALDRWSFIRSYRDYRQMLDEVKPDVVSICTWPQTHAEIVDAAAAAGVRGILCEKPLALQLSDINRMQEVCKIAGIKLAGGHQYRFHRNYMEAQEIIRSGGLGKVSVVRGHIQSTLANNGPHLIDSVRFLLGDPDAVTVSCKCLRERNQFNRGSPAEDAASGEVLFSTGARFEFATGDLAGDFFAITVEGDKGSLEVTPEHLKVNGAQRTLSRATTTDCRHRQFREFVRWIKGRNNTYSADFEQGARSAELVLSLYESAYSLSPVDLPLRNYGDIIGQLYPYTQPVSPTTKIAPSRVTDNKSDRLAMDGGRRSMPTWFSTAPSIGVSELANLTRVILSKNLSCTDGTMVPRLEREFSRLYGSPSAVASTSGTAAIHVALGALGLDPGDEVITTPMTDMGTVIPILASNCLPVFADVDPMTGSLSAEGIARRITSRTKAVILVHLFGIPANLQEIVELLKSKGIILIEDCAQAHFADYCNRKVGTFGDFGCFSLQQSKQITCGDGGVTLVKREDFAKRAAFFVDKGWDRKRGAREYPFLGMNYRMTELQGAVALAQLRKLPRLIAARRVSADRLTRQLLEIDGVSPPSPRPGIVPSWWIYPFSIDEKRLGISTDAFAGALQVEGVKVKRQYLPEPIFECDMLKKQLTYGTSRYPFSAFPYEPPKRDDFPGLREFIHRLMFISWSHNLKPYHADGIASAIRRVATLLPKDTLSNSVQTLQSDRSPSLVTI